MGRKSSEINFPFAAKEKDLPALPVKVNEEKDETETKKDPDAVEEFDWKKHLCKSIRLTKKTASELGERHVDVYST